MSTRSRGLKQVADMLGRGVPVDHVTRAITRKYSVSARTVRRHIAEADKAASPVLATKQLKAMFVQLALGALEAGDYRLALDVLLKLDRIEKAARR